MPCGIGATDDPLGGTMGYTKRTRGVKKILLRALVGVVETKHSTCDTDRRRLGGVGEAPCFFLTSRRGRGWICALL